MNKSLKDLLLSDHYASLTGELQCACKAYLQPPILLCTQGHGSCSKCRRRYQRCSTCKEEFTETRSVALEALADKLQFPCPHKGCKARVQLSMLNEHEASCLFRPTPCFMNKVYGGCNWKGIASEWLNHCIEKHNDKVSDLPFVKFSEPWSPRHRDPVMRYHLLRCFEKVFSMYQIYDSKSGKTMWTVISIGDEKEIDKSYYFDLEMYDPKNPMKKIAFRQVCKSESDADILDPSQNVLIPLEQILYMLDGEKNIHFNLRIDEFNDSDVDDTLIKVNGKS
ncbi:E3 ubiquitin-protein ligase siah-1-like isoform X2 [Arctopsyche grandis]|uniref:E3 ubiquitin-protein ligase siah-1-like isoform X2 n=1 Tax=Arctopsyche grandis TaxID=121162 RepID=UPI00406D780E